jgi:hypothetical protein
VSTSFIRFLNLIDSLDRMNPGRKLDELERELVEHILRCTSEGQVLLVGDLLQLNKLGSQATIHGRVKNLSALGYINLVTDKGDGRRKFVTPTKMAFKYSEFMSKCLERALRT